MTGAERREQIVQIARAAFAERGYDGASVEEIAARANVSKPVLYEHFGGKEGVYAVVVDREVQTLLGLVRGALSEPDHLRGLVEHAAIALLGYIETNPEGFRILVRDSPPGAGGYTTILGDVISRVEGILVEQLRSRGYDAAHAPMYAQMLVGMVSSTGQWWLDERQPAKEVVAAHVVNLAWNGLSRLEQQPRLRSQPD